MVAVSEEELGRLLGSSDSGSDSQSTGSNNQPHGASATAQSGTATTGGMNSSVSSEGSLSLGLGGGSLGGSGLGGGYGNRSNSGTNANDLSISLGGSVGEDSQGSLLLEESVSSRLSYKEEDGDAASLSTTLLDESTNNDEDDDDEEDNNDDAGVPILASRAKGVGDSSSSDMSDRDLRKGALLAGENDEAQEMMKDNLDLMLEIVMRIREDEEFASSIYDNCPRLQFLLDQHPDLRPVFEDPHLVQINFEKVYRDAGGVLPEDKPSRVQVILARIVNHPLFKILKFLILVKKIVNCILGGGFSFVRGAVKGCIGGLCCDSAADVAVAEVAAEGNAANGGGPSSGGADGGDGGEGGDGDDQHESSPENQANREALNRAADHMEDPEVQERMQDILELDDEDALADAIENDPELKALRDSNPLCAELMSDPETMRILVDPDNLRALGECPDLIEKDFANPDWSPPDIESGPEGASADGVDALDVDADAGGASSDALNGRLETVAEADFEGEQDDVDDSFGASQDLEGQLADLHADADADAEGNAEEEEEEELDAAAESIAEGEAAEVDGAEEEAEEEAAAEEEEEDKGGMEYELGDEVENENKDAAAAKGGKQQQKSQSKSSSNAEGRSGFIASAAVGLRDMLAAELIGVTYSEMTGRDDLIPLDQAEEAADTAAESATANAETMAHAVATSEVLLSDEVAGNLEEGIDTIEETHADEKAATDGGQQAALEAAGTAGGVAAVGSNNAAGSRSRDIESGHGDGDDTAEEVPPAQTGGEEEKKKSRFGIVGNWAGAVATAGKEYIASSILGDDLGEMLVGRLEADEDSDEDDEDNKKKEEEEEKSKPKGLFRRKEG